MASVELHGILGLAEAGGISGQAGTTWQAVGSSCMVEAHARVALHALRQPAQAA